MERLKMAGRRLGQDMYELRYAFLGIAVYYLLVHFLFGQFCPVMIFFHFPCPGCGMTRALLLVLRGHWAEAWQLQPLVYGWMVLGFWFGFERYIRNQKSSVLMKGYLIFLLLAVLGLYFWRLLHGFPAELL